MFSMCSAISGFFLSLALVSTALTPALACRGGFVTSHPRPIIQVIVKNDTCSTARLFEAEGRQWLVPTPEGLYDLEYFSNSTLGENEKLLALAFSLQPGYLCFTSAAPGAVFAENVVPVVACMDFAGANPKEIPAVLQETTDLTPAALEQLHAIHKDNSANVSLVAEAIVDRYTLDFLLFHEVYLVRHSILLQVEDNYFHNYPSGSSLVLEYGLPFSDAYIRFRYSIPLGPAKEIEKNLPALLQQIYRQNIQWKNRFLLINGLTQPPISSPSALKTDLSGTSAD